MSNRFYLISSLFFLAGSSVETWEHGTVLHFIYLFGSIFFFLAAAVGLLGKPGDPS